MTPSNIYLISLASTGSRVTMSSFLNNVAMRIQGVSTHELFDWSKLRYEQVLVLLDSMKREKKAPATINTYLAAIKGVAKEAWRKKLLPVDDYLHIKEVKKLRGSRTDKGRALPVAELKKLLRHCEAQNTVAGTRDAAIIALMYGAGLRRAEAASLILSDINLEEGSVRIMGKGNKEQTNMVSDNTLTYLHKYIAVRGTDDGSFFTKAKKGNKLTNLGITGQAVYNVIVQRHKEIGLAKVSPHDLRRSYATNLLENGEDIFTVSNLMRHSSVETTKVYDKRSRTVSDAAAKRLPF